MRDPLALPETTRSDVLIDSATGAVILAATAAYSFPPTPVIWAVAVTIGLAVSCRHIAPSAMIVFGVASFALQLGFQQLALLACLAYVLLFPFAGVSTSAAVRRCSLVAAMLWPFAAAWALSDPSVLGRQLRWGDYAVVIVATGILSMGSWQIGHTRYLRRKQERVRLSAVESRRLIEQYNEQIERARLARDMHDVVAHSLAVIIAQAEGARFSLDRKPESAREALGVIAGTGRDALADVRKVLEQLRSGDSAATATRDDRELLYARMHAAGMDLELTEEGDPESVDPIVVGTALQILTEALTNALKYGDLSMPVVVDHRWAPGYCHVTVANEIADEPLAPGGAQLGVLGMAERAAEVGGIARSGPDGDRWFAEFVVEDAPGSTA